MVGEGQQASFAAALRAGLGGHDVFACVVSMCWFNVVVLLLCDYRAHIVSNARVFYVTWFEHGGERQGVTEVANCCS